MRGANAKVVALTAMMTATLEIGKLALSSLANIEVVTLFTALFAYVFGFPTCIAVLCFTLIETAIYGFGSWIISYVIFWNLVALVFIAFKKFKVSNIFILTLSVTVLTAFFGVMTSFFDIAVMGFSDFFARFVVYYLRGIPFYVVHIVANTIIMLLLFRPLNLLFEKAKTRFA